MAVADDSTLLVAAYYSGSYSDSLYAVSTDGVVRWASGGTAQWWSYMVRGRGALVVGNGVAYLALGDEDKTVVRAVSVADGSGLWQVEESNLYDHDLYRPLALSQSGEVLIGANDLIVSRDAATGQENWRHRFADEVTDFVITESGLLVAASHWYGVHGYLEAIDIGSGPMNSAWPMTYADPGRTSRARLP